MGVPRVLGAAVPHRVAGDQPAPLRSPSTAAWTRRTDRRATTHSVRQSWWSRTFLVPVPHRLAPRAPRRRRRVDAPPARVPPGAARVGVRHARPRVPELPRALAGPAHGRTRANRAAGRRVRKLRAWSSWFQNTRGLVIIVLAVITVRGAARDRTRRRLPDGREQRRRAATPPTVTTVTTLPLVDHHHRGGAPHAPGGLDRHRTSPCCSSGSTRSATTSAPPDGSFGPGTKTQVDHVPDRTRASRPADGVVNAATWNALLANPSSSTAATTTTTKP